MIKQKSILSFILAMAILLCFALASPAWQVNHWISENNTKSYCNHISTFSPKKATI